jgi:hypothetical protein
MSENEGQKPEEDEDGGENGNGGDGESESASGSKSVSNKAAGMVVWTRRTAFFLGFCAFVVMFLVSYDFDNYTAAKTIAVSAVKGLCAGLLFWIAGLITGNIFLKGLITDVPVDQSHLVDGGILQRIYLYQQKLNYDLDGNVIQVDPRTDTIVRKNVKNKKEG